MGEKRRSKMKRGRAATKPASTKLDGVQKILTLYEGAAKVNPLNYVLISVGGDVGAEKNGRDGGRFDGGVSGSFVIQPPNFVTVTPVHSFAYCILII